MRKTVRSCGSISRHTHRTALVPGHRPLAGAHSRPPGHDCGFYSARVAFDVRLCDKDEPVLIGSAEDTRSKIEASEIQARRCSSRKHLIMWVAMRSSCP